VLATGRLPKGSVSPEEFEDPLLRSLCEGLLAGESAASLMERQTDDQGRAVIGDILSVDTDLDDDGLMHMAQDCLKRLRRQRLERALDQIQQRLPALTGEERERETQRAIALTQQLLDLK
jgi:nicotinamide riboside kinase